MKRRIIDLTYDFEKEMMVYPGLPKPVIEKATTIEKEGVNTSKLTFISHTGTHIDAPRHFVKNGKTIDKVSLDRLVGEAVFINLSTKKKSSLITLPDLTPFEDLIHKGDILLLNTGIYKSYGKPEFNLEFPTISLEAAQWIIEKGISTFATDATSVDPADDKEKMLHHTLLGEGIPIIEALANLGQIKKERFLFIALPLKIKDGDGAPCRAIAIEGVV
jgi:kynurenine formamidase